MATTPKVLLKRSSVAGRIPDSSDLQYGELAINFTDGKLYYKDDSNNIRAFIDSARVQAIADAVEITAQAQLDSSEVTALIDSAYIQTRVPLSYLEGLIDSAYIQARQDFAYSSLTGAPNVLDSADVTNIIDSAYVQARQSANTGTDSATVSAIIAADVDSAYVQSRQIRGADSAWVTSQIPTFGTDYIDSATASNIIVADVTKSFVDALGVNADTLDGFEGAHYLNWTNTTNKPRILDSAMVYRFTIDSARTTALIDSAYVQLRVPTNQELRTTSDVTFAKITGDSAALGQVSFSTTWNDSHIPFEEGAVWYDPHHKNLNYYTDFDHPIELGMQMIERCYNNNAYTILKGQPLYYSGNRTNEDGQESPTVALANATEATKYNVQGLAAEDIPQNSYGQIVVAGVIDNINTSSLNAGENFFAGLTDGAVQNAPPTYPNYPMCLGWVIVSDSNNGKVIINQQNHSVSTFRVQGDTHIGGTTVIDGNLTVNGTQTITSTENVTIGGNIQYLNGGDTIGEGGTTFVGSGLDDAFFSGHYSGDSSTKSFFVKIDATGGTDTFEWGFDSSVGTQATGIAITGNPQILDSTYGISIDFGATTGHTTGDKWVGTATATDVDTGIFTNRNTGDGGDGYTHLGLYYDVSQNEWTFVSEYEPEPESPINRSAPSFVYGDVRGKVFYGTTFNGNLTGNVTGNVTGTVSDISNHSTTDLSEGSNLYYTTARHDSDFDVRLATKTTTDVTEGTNLYYTTARVDSDIAASLTDSGNTVYINTTTIVTDQVDSAYVLARVNEAPFLDSTDAINLIDSAYVQARQITYNTSNFTDSAFVTGLPVSTFTNNSGYLTTATTTSLVDSAYIRARRPEEAIFNVVNNGASAYKFTGDGFDSADNPTLYLQRGLTYKFNVNASGHPFEIRLSNGGSAYSTGVTNNANQDSAVYFTPHMDAPNTLVYQCTVHSGMVGDIVIVDNNSFLDSSTVTGVITASYINALTIDADTLGGQAGSYYLNYNNFTNTPTTVDSAEVIKLITANAIDSAVALQLLLDSSEVVNLIDSAYVQARQSGGEITIQDEGTPLSTAATTLNFVGTAVTASGSGTTKTITISQAEGGTDSATVVTIIGETVDSAYVQARQTTGGGGLDSAAVLALSGGSQTGLYQQTFYRFQADSGQTVFTGTDAYGQTLNYGAGAVDVFLNGILLLDSADYTQTSSSTLTLIAAADSADEVHIIWRRGTLVTPNVTTYEYTATGGQVTFSGTAANGKTLAYSAGAIQVFKQGLLLKAGTDYTATDGTSVVLTSGATASDKIAISAYAAPHAKATSFNFTADSAQTTFNGLDNSSTVLSYEPENSLVFLNGIALSDSDFTATNGTSVVLATAANLNDELKVVSFGAVTSTLTNNNWTETATSMKISPNEKKFVDVSSAAVLLEIQDSGSNVSMGDELRIIDGYGNAATNNITLRSTKKIVGSDSDLIIDINRSGTNLVYYNESNGWVLIEN